MTTSALIDEMIAKTPDWRGAEFAKLRRLIHTADPDITEDVGWRRPANPLGAAIFAHNGVVCIGGILKDRIRLTFSAGTLLPDPHKLYNAMLNGKSRAIDFRQGEKLNEAAVKALVKAGVDYNLAKHKAPVKPPGTPK